MSRVIAGPDSGDVHMTAATEPSGPGVSKGPYARIASQVRTRLARDGRLYRNLPGEGCLFFDRALPFVVLYRTPPGRDDAGTRDILKGVASYCLASGERRDVEGVRHVLEAWSETVASQLGAFVVLEVWTESGWQDRVEADGGTMENVHDAVMHQPRITLHVPDHAPDELVGDLTEALTELRICPIRGGDLGVPHRLAEVRVVRTAEPSPPDMLAPDFRDRTGATYRLGLEISPFFRTPDGATAFPRVVLALRAGLANAIENAIHPWSLEETTLDAPHPRALARTAVGRSARYVDERLAEVYGAFDLLLQVTPVNTDEAWTAFRESGCSGAPSLEYRPLPFDPEHLKRRLFDVPIEKINDPLLADLFREKQEELDAQISLLRCVGTGAFVHTSQFLYGTVDDELVEMACRILDRVGPPHPCGEDDGADDGPAACDRVGANAFLERSREEIRRYRETSGDFWGEVEIRDDIAAGLLVSKGTLCISDTLSLPVNRVEALVQHEIGTHLVTHSNGRNQPFRLLASGLAGYDPLQEGLAVLAEYLVGGLTPGRARTLAARVITVRGMLEDRPFAESWRRLVDEYGFRPRAAFNVTVRAYRGGGLVKDALYLAGLRDLLKYLAHDDHSIEPLLIGKVALAHVDAVQELVLRGILRTPAAKPFWMNDPDAMARLEACRSLTVLDLIEEIAA